MTHKRPTTRATKATGKRFVCLSANGSVVLLVYFYGRCCDHNDDENEDNDDNLMMSMTNDCEKEEVEHENGL